MRCDINVHQEGKVRARKLQEDEEDGQIVDESGIRDSGTTSVGRCTRVEHRHPRGFRLDKWSRVTSTSGGMMMTNETLVNY